MTRLLTAMLLWCAAAVQAAETTDLLESARHLAVSGTPQLALALVEKAQPADPGASRWGEWEALRCGLLARLNRVQELLARAERLPPGAAAPPLRECLMPAARAAVGAGQAAAARRHAARLLWQGATSGDELRELQLLVIDSYVADGRGDDAYRSMLRFDLDQRPVERRTATRFIVALLGLGMAKEAVNWLASLDEGDPLRLMLRLQAGLVEPGAALKLARPAANKRPGAGWWGVVARAARMQGSRALQIEALEQLLQHSPAGDSSRAAGSRELWRAYFAAARESADRQHLLDNDDAGWSAFAASRANSDPMVARAVFAHLAQRGATHQARTNAQLQLELSLQLAKLDVAALWLFSDADVEMAMLDPRLRFSLGGVAEAHGLHAAVVQMWQGLPLPSGLAPIDWRLRLAAGLSLARGGYRDDARAQFEWVLRNSHDPAQVDVARRELKKL